jgi:glycosyltransferase involved in cell wall biosynthesis
MKVAIYDRYWPTAGGGEKFAAGIAAALAPDHDVTLLSHEPLDRQWLGERLQLDLSKVGVEQVEPDMAGAVAEATAPYDLFVNASFLSRDSNRAPRGVYVVHFPGFRPSAVQRALGRAAGAARRLGLSGGVQLSLGDGFYSPEPLRLHTLHWTAGESELVLRATKAGRYRVTLLLGRYVPVGVTPLEARVTRDDEVLGSAVITGPHSRLDRTRVVPLTFEVDLPAALSGAGGGAVTLTLQSAAWQPAALGIGADTRVLGVPLAGWYGGGGWRQLLGRRLPLLATEQGDRFDALDSYDQVLSNSQYTREWVSRMWHRPSDVLYPPVSSFPRVARKRHMILGVGRFFVPGTGHNKKQLELVGAFRRMVDQGDAKGWELHLVGGCAPEHQSYLDQVRAAGKGLPVHIHRDASGAELAGLYGKAAIFWHAAGLGEHAQRHPERQEHFGITTVEAMSAGAVPVVIDAAGQAEIVEQGVSGFRFRTVDELIDHTVRLAADEHLRITMSAAAERRAASFGWDAFVANVHAKILGPDQPG